MKTVANQVVIQGVLINKVTKIGLDKNNQEFASAELTIRTSELEEHIVRMYSKKFTKEGNVSKIYDSLLTIINEYKSANQEGVGVENADKVFIKNGEISMNRYSKDGEVLESRRLNTKFCERLEGGEFNPRAEFVLVGVVESVVPQMNMEEEVEYLKLNLIVPKGYNNLIEKIQVVIRNSDFFDYIEDNFTNGTVVRVGGDVINAPEKVEEEPQQTSGFGVVPKLNTRTKKRSELLATGGDVLYGMEEVEGFTEQEIQKGLELFNQMIEELKSIQPVETVSKPVGFGSAIANNPSPTPVNPFGNVYNTSMPNF